jgi:general nucleoside transport system permease protein
MSLAGTTATPAISSRRAVVTGFVFLATAVVIAVGFGLGATGSLHSTFVLNPVRGSVPKVPNLVIPSRGAAFALAAVCAFLGGVQLTRGFGRRTYLVLGIVVFLFVMAFLTWADRGKSLSLIGLLEGTLHSAVPITFGALCGVLCERAAVINIGIEGMLLTAAFTGSVIASVVHNLWIGMIAGALAGGLLAWLLALLAIRYRVDQIIAGTFINLFALGMTSYLSARVLEANNALNDPGRFQEIAIPLLSKIPLIGPIFFDNNIFIYILFLIIIVTHVGLFYTRWGLRVRAVGEHPEAADTVGIRVLWTRYRNVIIGGIIAGIGGAYFTLGSVGRFDENMTAGRGFIGLAAMIFGRWSPVGAFLAARVFGFADSLQTSLSLLNVGIPSDFLLMAPYLVTIAVVAGLVRRARPPAADGKPYIRQ